MNQNMKKIYSLFIIITFLSCNDKKNNNIKEHQTYIQTDTLSTIIDNNLNNNEDDIFSKYGNLGDFFLHL